MLDGAWVAVGILPLLAIVIIAGVVPDRTFSLACSFDPAERA